MEDNLDEVLKESAKLEKKKWYYVIDGKLIKKKKPCFIGDKIHLFSREGTFTVDSVNAYNLLVKTKHTSSRVDWYDVKCLSSPMYMGKSQQAKIRRAKRVLSNMRSTITNAIIELNSL